MGLGEINKQSWKNVETFLYKVAKFLYEVLQKLKNSGTSGLGENDLFSLRTGLLLFIVDCVGYEKGPGFKPRQVLIFHSQFDVF